MSPVVFAQPNPNPTPTVVLTQEVWTQRRMMNSTRTSRQLVGTVGQVVTEQQAQEWGVGGEPTEGYYFVEPEGEVEVVTNDELVKRAESLEVPGFRHMGPIQLRDAIEAAEKEKTTGKRKQATTVRPDETAAQSAASTSNAGTANVPPVQTTARPGPDDDDKAVQTQERKGPRRAGNKD